MSRAQLCDERATGAHAVEKMSEHDLIEVVEIEETCGLSLWGWDAYRAELDRPESIMLVVRNRSKLVSEDKSLKGFIAARLNADGLHVNNIGVRETERRAGLGGALLEAALSWAVEKGASSAVLEVRAANQSAHALYRRFGFRVAGTRKNYYRQPDDDALIMTALLKPSA